MRDVDPERFRKITSSTLFGASVKDGRGNTLSRRLFLVQAEASSALTIRQPTYLAELAFAPVGIPVPSDSRIPDRAGVE